MLKKGQDFIDSKRQELGSNLKKKRRQLKLQEQFRGKNAGLAAAQLFS